MFLKQEVNKEQKDRKNRLTRASLKLSQILKNYFQTSLYFFNNIIAVITPIIQQRIFLKLKLIIFTPIPSNRF